jgi:mannose-1-phosphate guanylyltransferase/mannose-6-phosphate isomerase
MRHAVIMAGGTGTRLWPLSRKSTPKQFQKLIGERTLLQQTYDRIRGIIDPEQVWVVTGEQYKELVIEQLPEILAAHIITEPVGRNTAPATVLATLSILKEDPEAVLFGLLPADHYVGKPKVFAEATKAVFSFIEKHPEYVVTIGVRPTEPNTGLGYIKMGDKLESIQKRAIFHVESFHEKPNQITAEEFVTSGEYLWNGGYYLFNGAKMIEYYEQLAPEILRTVGEYIEDPTVELYNSVPSEPIDKAISEKLSNLAVIPVEMDWSDIGNWATLHEILSEQGKSTEVVIGDSISDKTSNTLVMGGSKLIVTVGVKDIVVIDTDDVILICEKGSVQDVKKIVEQLQEQGREHLL